MTLSTGATKHQLEAIFGWEASGDGGFSPTLVFYGGELVNAVLIQEFFFFLWLVTDTAPQTGSRKNKKEGKANSSAGVIRGAAPWLGLAGPPSSMLASCSQCLFWPQQAARFKSRDKELVLLVQMSKRKKANEVPWPC